MDIKSIPIIGVGPGSQPPEEDGVELDYIALPDTIHTFDKPILPEPEEVLGRTGAMEAMAWLQQALTDYRPGGQVLAADLSGLTPEDRDVVNQILGEGEVSIRVATDDGELRTQEAVLAGVWRTFQMDDQGRVRRDLIEVCQVPERARRAPQPGAAGGLRVADLPPEVMNGGPILTELAEHLAGHRPGAEAHVINLTLLPLSAEDLEFLDERLGKGPVHLLSRGYGDCHIDSTAVPGIWQVRYYNSTEKLILNTLEVTDIPVVACAAPEDLTASAARLQDMLEPYRA